jgi:hypothetical protein
MIRLAYCDFGRCGYLGQAADAAAACAMDRQTLCDWVHRYIES